MCIWDEGWKAEELPLCALADDRVVEIQGDARHVQRAMELVVSHLRKFLVDRSVLPYFEHNVCDLSAPFTRPLCLFCMSLWYQRLPLY